jgi:hypothetical protein
VRLVGTTIYSVGAIEQTWIGSARFDGIINRANAAPNATPRFVLKVAPDRPTAVPAKRK